MPKRRPPKVPEKKLSQEDIEKFAKKSDDAIGDASILNPDAAPTIGLNIRFNSYEHHRLRQLAKKEGRSMQKQIKMILRKELGV